MLTLNFYPWAQTMSKRAKISSAFGLLSLLLPFPHSQKKFWKKLTPIEESKTFFVRSLFHTTTFKKTNQK